MADFGETIKSFLSGAANIFGEVRERRFVEKQQRDNVITQLALQAGSQNPEILKEPAFQKAIEGTMGKGSSEFLVPVLTALAKQGQPGRDLQNAAASQLFAPEAGPALPEGQAGPPAPVAPSPETIIERAKKNPVAAELVKSGIGNTIISAQRYSAGQPIIREVKNGDRVQTVQIAVGEDGTVTSTPLFDAPRTPGGAKPFKTTTNNLALLSLGLTPEQINAGEITPAQSKQAVGIVKERSDSVKKMAISVVAKMKRGEKLTDEEAKLFGGMDAKDVKKIAVGGMSLDEFIMYQFMGEQGLDASAAVAGQGGAPKTVPGPTKAPRVLKITPVPKQEAPSPASTMKPMKAG